MGANFCHNRRATPLTIASRDVITLRKMIPHTPHDGTSYTHGWSRIGFVILLFCLLVLCNVPEASEISVVPDQEENTAKPGADNRFNQKNTTIPDEKTAALLRTRQEQLLLYDPAIEEEERLMESIVQLQDRDSAVRWLSSYVSAKPLNCPIHSQQKWVEAILEAVERNRLPVCKEILALTATLISIESSFQVDPVAIDSSKGEDMASVLDRAEAEFFQKFGPLLSIPPVPQLYAVYKEKYYPRLCACRTEGDVEVLAKEIAEDLKKDAERLPGVIRNAIHKELDKLANVVRTKGSMQLNFNRARTVMRERGEQFTDAELTRYMYTMKGGIDVGVAALRPMFVQYAGRYGSPGNLSWMFFVGMDYHYGPFSSRNMMEQVRIRDLSGRKIAIDGDFLRYDDSGNPVSKESETTAAVLSIVPPPMKGEVLKSLLLEKDQQYIYTNVHRAIRDAHRENFGETPFAVIGELWMGESAQVKHGGAWKTRSYLNKLDKYLNSIPWDR